MTMLISYFRSVKEIMSGKSEKLRRRQGLWEKEQQESYCRSAVCRQTMELAVFPRVHMNL